MAKLPPSGPMVPLVLRVPGYLRTQLADLAAYERRTVSDMARLLLERGISNTDQRNAVAARARVEHARRMLTFAEQQGGRKA